MVSQTGTLTDSSSTAVWPAGIIRRIQVLTSADILCLVWFIPEFVNSLVNLVVTLVVIVHWILTSGPMLDKSCPPRIAPIGMVI
jgi:hypothetical protein